MVFEYNIVLNLIKTHLAEFSAFIDAGLIAYVLYLKRELSRKAAIEDLEVIKKYISDLFKHEIKNMRGATQNSIAAIDGRFEEVGRRITDLNNVLIAVLNTHGIKLPLN
jgi:hypothetical protein